RRNGRSRRAWKRRAAAEEQRTRKSAARLRPRRRRRRRRRTQKAKRRRRGRERGRRRGRGRGRGMERVVLSDLMAEYGMALDEDRLEDWVELFDEQCDYRVVTRENVAQGLPNVLMWCDNKNRLRT